MAETDKRADLTAEVGATFRATIIVFTPSGAVQNLSNVVHACMQISSDYLPATTPVVTLTDEDGAITIGAANGTVAIYITAEQMALFTVRPQPNQVPPTQIYFYDLLLEYANGDVVRQSYGEFTVYASITDVQSLPPSSPTSPGNSDQEDPLTTANMTVAAGAPNEAIVVANSSSTNPLQHLYSVTVAPSEGAGAVTLTDGSGGALLAVIPANFPGGEISLSAPKFFASSVYANTSGNGPAFSIGVGP